MLGAAEVCCNTIISRGHFSYFWGLAGMYMWLLTIWQFCLPCACRTKSMYLISSYWTSTYFSSPHCDVQLLEYFQEPISCFLIFILPPLHFSIIMYTHTHSCQSHLVPGMQVKLKIKANMLSERGIGTSEC